MSRPLFSVLKGAFIRVITRKKTKIYGIPRSLSGKTWPHKQSVMHSNARLPLMCYSYHAEFCLQVRKGRISQCTVAHRDKTLAQIENTYTNHKTLAQIIQHLHKSQNTCTNHKTLAQITKHLHKLQNPCTNRKHLHK